MVPAKHSCGQEAWTVNMVLCGVLLSKYLNCALLHLFAFEADRTLKWSAFYVLYMGGSTIKATSMTMQCFKALKLRFIEIIGL